MKILATLALMIPTALLAATLQTKSDEPKGGMGMQKTDSMSMMASCPMKLAGATVAFEDTSKGVSVMFTAKPENVAELRKRVKQMAAMHEGESSPAMMQGQAMMGSVKYEEIKDGAKVTLTPKDPSKLAEFRKTVRAHVEKMQKGDCSMMQGMMKGMGAKSEAKPEPKQDEIDHSAHHPEEKK